jgi:multidrug efflux system membrane fusion protein
MEVRMKRRISCSIAALLLAAACGGGWYLWGGQKAVPPAQRPVPPIAVRTALVQRQDMPIFLSGIGTVHAFNIVTIKTRVDGHLDRVAFVEGQHVTEGELLAQIDPRPFQAQLAQARAAKARNEALLSNARLDLERTSTLATREYASRQTLDTQRALVSQLEAAIQGDQATIDNATVQLGYATITSPITGRTGMRLVDKGNIVRATDSNGLVVITQLQPISVIFALSQDVLADIAKEMSEGLLSVLAYNREGTLKLGEGILVLVDNQVEAATGTLRLKANFDNRDNALWPGQFVNVRLLLRVRSEVVTIPAEVAQRGLNGTFAYVVKADQSVEQRPIKIDYSRDGVTVVEEGLRSGEVVVLDGQYKLRAGTRVQVAPAGERRPPQVGSASRPGTTP